MFAGYPNTAEVSFFLQSFAVSSLFFLANEKQTWCKPALTLAGIKNCLCFVYAVSPDEGQV